MATLNVKNVPDGLYRKLKQQARRQRRSIAQEVIQILEKEIEGEEELSILDLRGLGKEVWEGIDVKEYIRRERESWD